MNTEPVAIRGIVDDAPAPAVQRRQWMRVFFALTLVAATVLTIGLDEAKHWLPAVDLGLILDHELDRFHVVPGGAAARAGLPEHGSLKAIDDVVVVEHLRELEVLVSHRLVITRRGAVHALQGVSTVRVERFVDDTTRPISCASRRKLQQLEPYPAGLDPCTGAPLVVDITVDDNDVHLVRDVRAWRALSALPIVVLVAAVIGAAGGLSSRRRRRLDTVRRLRHRSFVWFAVAVAVVTPAWLHVAFLTILNGAASRQALYELAILTTVPGWIVLVVMAARAAARHADGDFTTSSRWWPLAVAVVPTVVFVTLPGFGVVLTAVVVLRVLKRLDRAAIDREAPETLAEDLLG